jgi:UDP-hydrolysing UDP-N-acetyl-D-glucosamine 2-epimerase
VRRKICVVVTARPSYSRIKSALQAIHAHKDLELQVVVTGSTLLEKYGAVWKTMQDEGIPLTRRIYTVYEGENPVTSAKSTGMAVTELATAFDGLRPDAVVTIADRYETLATSIAAAYMNIPLVHVQGGEVTGSIDEKVRHANTKLADCHFTASELAKERVVKLGENRDHVHNTGCPSIDLARAAVATSGPILRNDEGVGSAVQIDGQFIVVLQHPVTTDYGPQTESQVIETLCAVHELDIPTLWFWPNVDAGSDYTSQGIRRFRERYEPQNIRFVKNLPPESFIRLLGLSKCIVGNSSVAIRECAYLGVPAINIGSRQAGRDRGANVVDVPCQQAAIVGAIEAQIAHGKYPSDPLYGDGTAGQKMADILATAELTIDKRLPF